MFRRTRRSEALGAEHQIVSAAPAGKLSLFLVALVAIGAACGGGPSSNGEAKKDATQILADAKTALSRVSSLHLVGVGGGAQLDVALSPSRGGGTIAHSGQSFQIVAAGGDVYLKADAATWQKVTGDAASQILADRWVKAPATDKDFKDLASLVVMSSFLDNLTPDGTITKGTLTRVDGAQAIPLIDSTGSTLYVAATGPPYVLKIVDTGTSSDGPGTITFDQYNKATVPNVPTNALDLAALKSG